MIQLANQDFFALLLAGIDEKKSAAEINKQLNGPEFKSLVDKIKIEFKIDDAAFKNLNSFLEGQHKDVGLVKSEVQSLMDLYRQLDQRKLDEKNTERRGQMMDIAGTKGLVDTSSVKETFDADTGALKGMNIEAKNVEGTISRIKILLDDDGFIQVSDIKVTNELNKELNLTYKNLDLNIKSMKNLINLEGKEGSRADRQEQINKLEQSNLASTDASLAKIQAALERNQISEQQAAVLRSEVNQQWAQSVAVVEQYAQSVDSAHDFASAKTALADYKKDYKELIDLEDRVAKDPGSVTDAEKARANDLRLRVNAAQELISIYPNLKSQMADFQSQADSAFSAKNAAAEVKAVEKTAKDLIVLYDKLEKEKAKALKAEVRGKSDPILKETIASIEKEIDLRNKSLQAARTSADGQKSANQAIAQSEAVRAQKSATYSKAEEKAYADKAAYVREYQGVLQDTSKMDTGFLKLGEDLNRTTPGLEKMAKALHTNQAVIKSTQKVTDEYGNEYLEMTVIHDKGAKTLEHSTYRLNLMNGEMGKLKDNTTQNVSRAMSFVEQISHATKKMAVWGVAARALYGSMRQLREGFTFVQELDKDLTQAAIVTGKSRSQVQGLAQDYARLGVEMGKTVKEISAVNTELLRQGLTIQESQGRLQTIIKLSATGQISTDDALQVVTTAVNAMQESHVHAADVILRASNISASSVEQLGEAFTKTASSAYATGMELEQVTGILATMLEVTQEGPSQLGTSLKTILARFSRVNEETGEFNEELNKVQGAIESVGIRFLDADGQIRNVYSILEDLSKIWPTLTKNQQAYIATTSAGVRMQNRFFAVMNNFDRVKKITEETGQAAGTMNKAYLTYLDGVEAASNRMQASLQQLWINTINSDALVFLYDVATGLIQVADSIGGVEIALNSLGLVALAKLGVFKGLFQLFSAGAVAAQAASVAAGTAGSVAATGLATMIIPGMKVVGLVTLLGIAVNVAAKFVSKKTEADKKANDALVALHNTYSDLQENQSYHKDQIDELGSSYEKLANKVRSSGVSAKEALSAAEFEEFTRAHAELLAIMPDLSQETNIYGDSLLVLKGGVEGLHAEYEAMTSRMKDEFASKHGEMIDLIEADTERWTDSMRKAKEAQDALMNPEKYNVVDNPTPFLDKKIFGKKELSKDDLQEAIDNGALAQVEYQKMLSQVSGIWFTQNREDLGSFEKMVLESTALINQAMEEEMDPHEFYAFLDAIQAAGSFEAFNQTIDAGREGMKELNDVFETGLQRYSDYSVAVDEYIDATLKKLDVDLLQLRVEKRTGDLGENELILINAQIEAINRYKVQIKKAKIEEADAEEGLLQVKAKQNAMYLDATKSADKYKEALDNLNKGLYKTQEGYQDINDNYPELVEFLGDEAKLREVITEKIEEQRRMAATYYLEVMSDSEEYYKSNKTQLNNMLIHAYKVRQEDLDGSHSFNEAKRKAEVIFTNRLLETHKDLYEGIDGLRAASLEGQLKLISLELKQIAALDPEGRSIEMNVTEASLIALRRDIQATIDELAAGLDTIKLPMPKLPGGGSGKDKSGETEKYIVQLETYYKLNEAMAENQRLLSFNAEYIERAVEGSEEELQLIAKKHSLLSAQKKILEQLNTAQRKDRNSYAQALEKMGFKMEGLGDSQRIVNKELVNTFKEESVVRAAEIMINSFDDLQSKIKEYGLAWLNTNSEIIDSVNSLKEARISAEIAASNTAYEKQQEQLQALDQMQEHLVAFIRDRYKQESEAQAKLHKNELDDMATALKAAKSRYKEDLDAFKSAIQGKIDALNKQHEEEDYNANLQDERENASVIQAQIDTLALDDSRTAYNQRMALQEELAKVQKKIETMQSDRSRTLQIEDYKKEIQLQEDLVDEKVNSLDKEYEKDKTRIEKLQQKEKDSLDARYTNQKIYAEVRQALLDGEILNFNGKMIEIEQAVRTVTEESGEQFGILGETIERDFTAKLEDALIALEALNQGRLLQPVNETQIRDNATSKYNNRPTEFADWSDDKYNTYVHNKKIWEIGTPEQKALAAAQNKEMRAGIKDEYSYEDLINWKGYAYGGQNTTTGLHMLHGTKSDPEWIFNSNQLDQTILRAIKASLQVPVPARETPQSFREEINIEKLIHIEGNVTKETIPLIKDAGDGLARRLKKELKKIGSERVAF